MVKNLYFCSIQLFKRRILLISGIFSCEKEKNLPNCGLPTEMYKIAQTYYLWNTSLPSESDFVPCNYINKEEELAQKIRTYSPYQNGRYNDRFTFVLKKQSWDNIVVGKSLDTGMGLMFENDNDFRVIYSHSASASGKLGIKRGWKVLSVNGILAIKNNIEQLKTELSKTERVFEFQKPDLSIVSHSIIATEYIEDYIINPTVISENGKNIGYFMFNSFLGGGNAGQETIDKLKNVFADFKTKNVNELIVDLRYNGGGYGNVAQELANLIAPTSANGKVFVENQHNDAVASKMNKKYLFKNSLLGLNLSRVVFITSHETASASEELINGLKPVMNVKLIGTSTYGKPVGYYSIPVQDYYFFPVAIKNVNSVGFSEFFDGFMPDKVQDDDLKHDFGSPQEACMADALNYFKTGKLARLGVMKVGAISPKLLVTKPQLKVMIVDSKPQEL